MTEDEEMPQESSKSFKQKALDFLLGRQTETEEYGEITQSFINYVHSERPYKLAASLSFVILVFFIGMPMWHFTTSTYRSNFPTFPSNQSITVPIRVIFVITSEDLRNDVKTLMNELEVNMTKKEVVAPLDFTWTTQFIGLRSFEHLEQDHSIQIEENKEFFDVFVALVPEKVRFPLL